MSTWKNNGPLVLKTYAKHKTKVEAWISPDIRKRVFSSTSSSDLSVAEKSNSLKPIRRTKRFLSTASSRLIRKAKQKALTALTVSDSDEESVSILEIDYNQDSQKRRGNLFTKSVPKSKKGTIVVTAGTSKNDKADKKASFGSKKRKNSENMRKDEKRVRSSNSFGPPSDLGKFVTDRRRMNSEKNNASEPKRMKTKTKVSIIKRSLDSSNDFKSPHFHFWHVAKRNISLENEDPFLYNTGSGMDCAFSNLSHTRNITKDMSVGSTNDRMPKSCYKKPLLSSTPSLAYRTNYRHRDPSVSEISFNSDDVEDTLQSSVGSTRNLESAKPQKLGILVERNIQSQNTISKHIHSGETARKLRNSRNNWTASQHSKELFSLGDKSSANKSEMRQGHLLPEQAHSVQSSQESNFLSADTPLDSLVAGLKERCRRSWPKVCLENIDVSKCHLIQNSKEKEASFTSSHRGEALGSNQSGSKFHGAMELLSKKETCSVGSPGNMSNACQAEGDEQRNGRLEVINLENVRIPSVFNKSLESTTSVSHCELRSKGEKDRETTSSSDSQEHCSEQSNRQNSMELFAKMEYQGGYDPVILSPGEYSPSQRGGSLSTKSHEAVLTERCISLQPTVALKSLHSSEYDCNNKGLEAGDGFDFTSNGKESGIVKASGAETKVLVKGFMSEENNGVKNKLTRRNGNGQVRRKLSSMYASSADEVASSSFDPSTTGKWDACRVRVQEPPKDKQGTGRKACVSGFSVSRWTKKGHGQRPKGDPSQSLLKKTQDHSSDSTFGLHDRKCFDTMNSWLQGTSGLFPGTPMYSGPRNVSSFLANLSPDNLTTHTWSRLKAVLLVHKKKKAFLTPKKLRLSHNQSSERDLLHVSRDLSASACTPNSSHLKSLLLTNAEGTHLDITDAEKVYHECQQEGPITFEQCIPPDKMKLCKKIGEGTFGEVFSTIGDSMETVALKIIPIEGNQKVNGEDQKTFGEVLHEIIISKELSSLGVREKNQTEGFIGLKNLHCVRGSYPELLLKAWDKFDKQSVSENDRPDFFGENQLFLILVFEFGGSDLEKMNGKLSSLALAKSILHQVTAALAVAEQALCFEHRDLHWGNILVKTTKETEGTYVLNAVPGRFETKGVLVNIIDYSLSRLEIDDLTVSCDISADEELFMGKGDYQFDIYRKMREENNNSWSGYNPHTNVLWLHYLVDKLLHMSYRNKGISKPMKELRKHLTSFSKEVLSFSSATDVLESCSLFQ